MPFGIHRFRHGQLLVPPIFSTTTASDRDTTPVILVLAPLDGDTVGVWPRKNNLHLPQGSAAPSISKLALRTESIGITRILAGLDIIQNWRAGAVSPFSTTTPISGQHHAQIRLALGLVRPIGRTRVFPTCGRVRYAHRCWGLWAMALACSPAFVGECRLAEIGQAALRARGFKNIMPACGKCATDRAPAVRGHVSRARTAQHRRISAPRFGIRVVSEAFPHRSPSPLSGALDLRARPPSIAAKGAGHRLWRGVDQWQ